MAEASPDRLRRLLTLVPWLAAHSGVTKLEAAQHFGLTQAQLEADLELITVTGPGLYGGDLVDIYFDDETITVYDAQGLVQPVHLSSEESAALLLGLHALQQMPDLDAAVVAGLIDKLHAAAPAEPVVVRVQASPHVDLVARALAEGRDLRIEYVHPVRDEATRRTVTPSRIVTRDGVDYLHGWCHTAGAIRTFRLDRIRQCEMAEASATPVDDRMDEQPQRQAVLLVDPAFEHLLEGVPAEVLERSDRLRVRLEFADEAWLEAWLIACGHAVQCLDPVSVAQGARDRAARALAAYDTLA